EVASMDSGSLEISAGDQKVRGTAAKTGDYAKFKVSKLGTLEITSPGKVTFGLRAVKDGWHPVNVKAIRLKPAAKE
ncbi:MAG TPA: hypothetical protein VNZ22_09630, partial [Bacillota bacterium]|nr:hypothetical protein [Bacillota bacterium]